MSIPNIESLGYYVRDYQFMVAAFYNINPYRIKIVSNDAFLYNNNIIYVDDANMSKLKYGWSIYQAAVRQQEALRIVGVGMYCAYYFESCGYPYSTIQINNNIIILSSTHIGQTIDEVVEEAKEGTASIRSIGAVTAYDEQLYQYWIQYRNVERLQSMMLVPHLSDDELDASQQRIKSNMIPRRRYNTPAIKLGNHNRLRDRILYKSMALTLINQLSQLLNLGGKYNDRDIEIDRNGVLYVPINDPKLETTFSTLWRRVDIPWPRLDIATINDIPLGLQQDSAVEPIEIILYDTDKYQRITVDGQPYDIELK